jgi:hypothetical protein
MRAAEGFSYEIRSSDVAIFHHGRKAARLSGSAARRFLGDVEAGDPQGVMARVTGNYRRGNERAGKNHPRNRG